MYCPECELHVSDESSVSCPVCQGPLQSEAETGGKFVKKKSNSWKSDSEIKLEDKLDAYVRDSASLDFDPEALGLETSDETFGSEDKVDDIHTLAELWDGEDLDTDLESIFSDSFTSASDDSKVKVEDIELKGDDLEKLEDQKTLIKDDLEIVDAESSEEDGVCAVAAEEVKSEDFAIPELEEKRDVAKSVFVNSEPELDSEPEPEPNSEPELEPELEQNSESEPDFKVDPIPEPESDPAVAESGFDEFEIPELAESEADKDLGLETSEPEDFSPEELKFEEPKPDELNLESDPDPDSEFEDLKIEGFDETAIDELTESVFDEPPASTESAFEPVGFESLDAGVSDDEFMFEKDLVDSGFTDEKSGLGVVPPVPEMPSEAPVKTRSLLLPLLVLLGLMVAGGGGWFLLQKVLMKTENHRVVQRSKPPQAAKPEVETAKEKPVVIAAAANDKSKLIAEPVAAAAKGYHSKSEVPANSSVQEAAVISAADKQLKSAPVAADADSNKGTKLRNVETRKAETEKAVIDSAAETAEEIGGDENPGAVSPVQLSAKQDPLAPEGAVLSETSRPEVDKAVKEESEKSSEPVRFEKRELSSPEPVKQIVPTSNSTGFQYVVHIGSFRSMKGASRQLAKLSDKGFDAYQVEVDLGEKGVWQRIYVPGGALMADAKAVKAELAESFPREESLIWKLKK